MATQVYKKWDSMMQGLIANTSEAAFDSQDSTLWTASGSGKWTSS